MKNDKTCVYCGEEVRMDYFTYRYSTSGQTDGIVCESNPGPISEEGKQLYPNHKFGHVLHA